MRNIFKLLLLLAITLAVLVSCEFINSQHNHSFSKTWSFDANEHWRPATCGHDELEVNRGEHEWDAGAVTAQPTEEAEGVFTITCTVCKMTKESPIARLPHTHKFETDEYKYNANYHWKMATCEHSDVSSGAEPHTLIGNTCLICGYMAVSEGLAFSLRKDGTYMVVGKGSNTNTNVVIPATYQGVAVTAIGSRAFGESLAKVVIPSSVKTISSRAFAGCTNLTEVIWEGTPSVTSIGDYAFANCDAALKSFTIPASVTKIGSAVFHTCTALTEIIVEEGNLNYKSENGVLLTKDGKKLLQFPAGKSDATYTIPDTVTTLDLGAFASNDEIKEIIFPEGSTINTIPTDCFYYCVSLESISIPNVNSIGDNAFSYCQKLASVNFPSTVTSVGNSAFKMCTVLERVDLNDGILNIGEYAFSQCNNITEITVPSTVVSIGSYAFSACLSLAEVNIPKSVVYYGDYLFFGSASMQNVNVDPENTKLSSIDGNLYTKDGKKLIYYCVAKEQESFTLPETVTTIGSSSFYYALKLKSVILNSSLKTIEDTAFFHCENLQSIEIPDSVTAIGAKAFSFCTSLVSVKLSAALTTLSEELFTNCSSLTSITIPASVTRIEKLVFAFLPKLTAITFEDPTGWLRQYTFDLVDMLEEIPVEKMSNPAEMATFMTTAQVDSIWYKE